jgi:hypothetical protein
MAYVDTPAAISGSNDFPFSGKGGKKRRKGRKGKKK